ncbi:hypothetical protein P5673_024877 [Acropora cervicornis]|uniref:Uncharacterized protein n=1 Tax=Acropora cervicornis TaxID=6130 RepID=A0AAD9UXJ0_ACRCE|nr:hypothetical protein P5673_024877 [Acropora cervicornis]
MPLPSTVQMSGSWTFVVGLPAVSARYPIRLKEPKPLTDQEAVPEDYRVHVYHSKQDRMWVQQWIIGMLQANRFNVTTNKQSSRNGSRVILVLTPELLNEAIRKTVLGIKLRDCDVEEEIKIECNSYMDLTTNDLSDFTLHEKFRSRVLKSLKMPLSICSA